MLQEIIPCADRVRYSKSGADAVTATVRFSRAHTGRDKIWVSTYAGLYVVDSPIISQGNHRHSELAEFNCLSNDIAMLATQILLAASLVSATPPKQVQRNGMTVQWQVAKNHLVLRAEAPTTGWLVVGFNQEPGLHGARLVFMRVRKGKAECEVHRTDFAYPAPYHRPRTEIGGTNYTRGVTGAQQQGKTKVGCTVPLNSYEPLDVVLEPGRTVHVILAYSVSDDFDHHSRMRTAVELEL